MKKKKENENTSRVYLKSWEQKFPWITKGEGPNGEGQFSQTIPIITKKHNLLKGGNK